MPLYEYECAKCGERTEAIQSFSEPPLTVCPHCGGALTKLLSSPAVQFKGAGWYVTDYGKSGGKKDGEKREGDSAKGEEGAGGDRAASSGAPVAEAKKAEDKTGDSPKGKKGKKKRASAS